MLRERVTRLIPAKGGPAATPDADAAILKRIAAGDRLAFEALYRGYAPRLMRFLQRLLRRQQTAEEVLNDTMMVVWRKAASFNGDSKVSTWVFAIAYRKALKAMKGLDDPVESDDDLLEAPQPGPEALLMQEQSTALLWEIIGRMSADHRAVIELTYYHGYTYREISEIVGCPVNTVKTRMFHARKQLQNMLSGRKKDLQ